MSGLHRVRSFPLVHAHRGWIALVLGLGIAYPALAGFPESTFLRLDYVLTLIVVATALNVVIGFAGQYLMGIGVVFAVGGYAAVLVAVHYPHIAALPVLCLVGMVCGILGGLVVSLPALRVANFYLALVSIFAALALPIIASHVQWLGKESGLTTFVVLDFKPKLNGLTLYLALFGIMLATLLFSWAVQRSRVGRRFAVLHASEHLTAALGISTLRTKMLAAGIASAIAGLAGGMYVYSQQFFSPGSASVAANILLLAALVIGGQGSIWGPMIGGAVVFGMNQFVNGLGLWTDVLFGSVLLLCVLWAPAGLVNLVRTQFAAPRSRAVSADAPAAAAARRRATARSAGPLELRDVRKAFGGVLAVDDVALTVEPGTVHGLIGSNGSGKTTLLNLISGFYRADGGTIVVGDARIDRLSPHRRAALGLARTFQSPRLMLGGSTALENVLVAADMSIGGRDVPAVLGLPTARRADRQARSIAFAALERLGIEHVADTPANSLPHGTRRLVELARAAAAMPRFVLVDEPAAGLSVHELDALTLALRGLADSGVGVLLIEHNVPEVLRLATTVTVMHQGGVLFQGTPPELRENSAVASAFLGMDEEDVEVLA